VATIYYGYKGIESFGDGSLGYFGQSPSVPAPPWWLLASAFVIGMVWWNGHASSYRGIPRRRR
jgi:hypothetical protein